ncbi:MATE family efflux transporter [Halorarum salinum]|uniref:Multidrug-efflux transporter n=1 Tax=Halorarum salinum TaxID=2743089 RepID=A0A7D5QKT8_9EURY|nr:MATE family efflux transporter [Halobaculum salinum]QLG62365.1 MATE family efflux transporter [Halobaculum salinum]
MGGFARPLDAIAGVLERFGVIDAERLDETVALAWPRVLTGFAIMSKQAVDLALVGLAVGATAVAGLAYAGAYWQVAKFVGIGLAGGTVSLVSQNYGGGEGDRASLVVEQSVWLALVLSIPIVAGYWLFATPLVGLLGSDPDAVRYGSTYLAFVAPGVLFEFLNLIASRTYAGVGDTFTPMAMRAGGALLNVVLSAALIFGAGLGVAGAAIGTTVSTGVVLCLLAWGMLGREYGLPRLGASPVPLVREGPRFDGVLVRQLIEVSTPLMGRRAAEGLLVFPLLWIASSFGPVVVAAIEVGRRVRALVNCFSWGFSIAASTLVGQRLGAGEEREAEAYGAAIVRLSAVVYLVVVALVVAFATPIAGVFVGGPEAVGAAATFVRVAAVSAVALGVDGSATGVLRGAGDTRWPFLASLIGRYAFALPVALLATATPLGVVGLYLALLLETLVPGVLNLRRFRTNRWKGISRAYRPASEPG